MVFYNIANEGNLATIRAKAHKLLKQAAKYKEATDMALDTTDTDASAGGAWTVPEITLRIQVPKIQGRHRHL